MVVLLGFCTHVASLSLTAIAECGEITRFLTKPPFRIHCVPIFCDLNNEAL